MPDRNGDAEDVVLCESVDRDGKHCKYPAKFEVMHGLSGLHSLACGVHKPRAIAGMGIVVTRI